MTSLTACQAEAAWLATTVNDGLPNLLTANGGTLDLIQAYMPRNPAKMKRALYLIHADVTDQRTGNQQAISTHRFTAKVFWPLSEMRTPAETAQEMLDRTVSLIIGRVRGFPADHTHGGAFLSVAEGVTAEDQDARIAVTFEDPDVALLNQGAFFRADITYTADDWERTA